MAAQQAKKWFISGRVQGVGFRYFVQKRAAELKLDGWTRNLEDGRVEVYAVGSSRQLSELAASLHKGPSFSDVRGVEESEQPVEPLNGFRIK